MRLPVKQHQNPGCLISRAGQGSDTNPSLPDHSCDDLTDQPRVVFIEFGRSGVAVPCLFQPFIHNGVIGRG